MAWCLLLVLLLLSTAAGDILQVCEEKETTDSYFGLYRLDSTSGFPCECVITSTQTLSFVFKRNTGGDHSTQSGDVTLRSMNGDKYNEVLLVDREVVNGSHFVLTFPKAPFKGETNIHVLQANEKFTLKCSSKVHGGRNSTNTVTQKNQDKEDTNSGTFVHTSPYTVTMEASTTPVPDSINEVVVAVSCAAAVASVLFGIAVVWCVRTRKQRLQVTDKRQDNLYDIADHLIEARAASPPMTSLMTDISCDSGTHSANTAFHTNTTLRTDTTDMLSPATAPRTVSETDYDTAGDTVRRPECLQHTEHDTYTTLKRDCPRGEAGTTGVTVYDQCHPPTDTHRGSGDNGRPLDDTYSRLQRGQERQPVIGNIYDTTSVAVAVLSGL